MSNTERRWRAACLCVLLSGCAGVAPAPAGPAATAAASVPAATPYNAATTYAKLVRTYPFIHIASAQPTEVVKVVSDITYVRRAAHALKMDLYVPAHASAPVAAVVLVHGGGWRSGERANLAPLALRLAERGFAAAVIDYRLADEARYPAAIHDVKAALRWVRAHGAAHGIDARRIAVAGGSAGGQIASLAGVTNGMAKFDPDGAAGNAVSSAAQAVINIDGLSDFTSPAARANEDDPKKKPSAAGFWFGGTYAEAGALWREASPIFHVGRDTPPMLFIGSGQARFSVGREEMVARMRAAGVATEVVLLPDTPHSFWLFDPWLQPTVDAIAAFLTTHLPTTTRQP